MNEYNILKRTFYKYILKNVTLIILNFNQRKKLKLINIKKNK